MTEIVSKPRKFIQINGSVGWGAKRRVGVLRADPARKFCETFWTYG
jgi:hypothetical protein